MPVAGADRLVLTDQIGVQDLLVLGDFLTLPEDDLALATVLKSPLFGLDDDALLILAHGRKGSCGRRCWRTRKPIRALPRRPTICASGARKPTSCRPMNSSRRLLEREQGRFRTRLLSRLGPDAADPIDELLNLALAYDEQEPPSLQGFLTWLRAHERQIKRDMEQGRNEVRVMTVHGAKGLEAPIVFLPDTCSTMSAARPGSLLKICDREPARDPDRDGRDLVVVAGQGNERLGAGRQRQGRAQGQ